MGFVDEAEIAVKSGDGGAGCISFRSERFVPKGGPDGGDGGKGGDVFFKATRRLYSLYDFSARRYFKAQNGRPGRSKNKAGKKGRDIEIQVPVGTMVKDKETGELLADLVHDAQQILLVAGGEGGRGNSHFATATNRAPRFAQEGQKGREKRLKLELKLIADIGIIGLPNAGKSTLLSRLSNAHPKIANYPFTTLAPNLGVIILDDEQSLTIADIPGLVEGASNGRGLGHRFLGHIERTSFLLHLLLNLCHGVIYYIDHRFAAYGSSGYGDDFRIDFLDVTGFYKLQYLSRYSCKLIAIGGFFYPVTEAGCLVTH